MKDLPLSEITLRKYEKPVGLEKRDLVKKICLSLGLLQLGDSRDVIVDILMVLIENRRSRDLGDLINEEIKRKVSNNANIEANTLLADNSLGSSEIDRIF